MKYAQLYCLFAFLFFWGPSTYAQEERKIRYESERTLKDEQRYPGAFILSKVNEQVHFIHQGIEVWCDQAIHYAEENFFKAYGNVRMEQGDTVTMTSQYAEYNGNTKFAFASGNSLMDKIILMIVKLTTGPASYPGDREFRKLTQGIFHIEKREVIKLRPYMPTIAVYTLRKAGL